jgi:ATP-binding cassette subfamily F protein uup
LMDFPGCLLVVSHDRYFMDKIVDHLFVFRGQGVIQDFPGNYSDFRTYEDSASKTKKTETIEESKPKNDWKANNDKAKLSYNEQKEYSKLESQIAKLERERDTLQGKFATEKWDGDEINKQSNILQKLIDQVDKKTTRYFELLEKLEN